MQHTEPHGSSTSGESDKQQPGVRNQHIELGGQDFEVIASPPFGHRKLSPTPQLTSELPLGGSRRDANKITLKSDVGFRKPGLLKATYVNGPLTDLLLEYSSFANNAHAVLQFRAGITQRQDIERGQAQEPTATLTLEASLRGRLGVAKIPRGSTEDGKADNSLRAQHGREVPSPPVHASDRTDPLTQLSMVSKDAKQGA